MKMHNVELNDEYEKPVIKREKTFEIRNNDRDYKVGDILVMQTSNLNIYCIIIYVLLDYIYVSPGCACLGIDVIGHRKSKKVKS